MQVIDHSCVLFLSEVTIAENCKEAGLHLATRNLCAKLGLSACTFTFFKAASRTKSNHSSAFVVFLGHQTFMGSQTLSQFPQEHSNFQCISVSILSNSN